jgi:SpoVK/Ycf46/Vps4 family AAA+-type ATPase
VVLVNTENLAYTLMAVTRVIKRVKHVNPNAVNEYYEPKHINAWADEIAPQFASETEAYEEVKNCLKTLVKYGYLESKLEEKTTYHPYKKGVLLTYKTNKSNKQKSKNEH